MGKSQRAGFKKEKNRCSVLARFEATNKIQPREHSKGSGTDGTLCKLWTVGVNWDGGGWGVSAYSIGYPYDWYAGVQVFGCNYLLSPAPVAGVFASKPLLQPPIIFPISSTSLPSEVN